MRSHDVKTAADARQLVEERGLTHIKVGLTDLDGIMRGKYLAREKFFSALDNGFGFCSVIFGWDSNDQLYDAASNIAYTGWHNGYPDDDVRIIPESCRELPAENTLLFLSEMMGEGAKICPRNVLKRVLNKASDMGFTVNSGFEYEFFGFEETPQSAREKGYRNLKLLTPSSCAYSVLRTSTMANFYRSLLDIGHVMGFEIEGLHTEAGNGAMEAALTVSQGLLSADKAALFKTFSKVTAQQQGIMLSFMAKFSLDLPGCGGHLHLSLQNQNGVPLFHDSQAPHTISRTMRHFVAGQQRLMPELLCMTAPTVNSFSRLIPGYWAPTSATWGIDNRTCALRVIKGSPKSQRVEYRVTSADANPYLVQAAVLASGLWGIEHQLELPDPIEGNAYTQTAPADLELPRTLAEAAQRFRQSKAARASFGDAFVDHFASTREWEEREFRRHITDWELQRYFEMI